MGSKRRFVISMCWPLVTIFICSCNLHSRGVSPSLSPSPSNNAELDATWTPQWNSLVSYYKIDNNWMDDIGINHAVATGATFTSFAKLGNGAGAFNGNFQYAQTPVTVTVNPTSEITIHAWVYPNGSNQNNGLVNKGPFNSSQGDFSLSIAEILGANGLSFFINWPAGQVFAPNPPHGTWTHLVATYDGTTMKIYENGLLANSAPYSGQIGSSDTFFTIGGYFSNNYTFNGDIDDVAIWSKALTAAEVNVIYSRQYAP